MVNIPDDDIKNENEAQIENYQEVDNNNIQANTQIFEDANYHNEEINEKQGKL